MIPLIRFYQVVKLLKEHNELRYHRLTNVLTSLAKVTFEDTFLVKVKVNHLGLSLVMVRIMVNR